MPDLIDAVTTTHVDRSGQTVIQRSVAYDDDFIDTLKSERHAKAHMHASEIDRVAAVPAHVVDIWLRQGFDFWKARPRDIVARLRSEGLDDFITTPKRV